MSLRLRWANKEAWLVPKSNKMFCPWNMQSNKQDLFACNTNTSQTLAWTAAIKPNWQSQRSHPKLWCKYSYTHFLFYICIVHLTCWGFMSSRQDNFTLLSHGKQVDGTEEEVLHREPPHHLQAQCGFLTSSPNGVQTCSITAMEDQVIRNQWLTAWTWKPPILHLNVVLFL